MKSVVLVSAGVSSSSSTTILCSHIARSLQHIDKSITVETIELHPIASGLAQAIVTGIKSEDLSTALSRVGRADALIMATPIYKSSYSGLFKLFIDLLDQDAIVNRPVLLAATGGTVRHSLALDSAMRTLFGYMRAMVVPTVVYATPEDWAKAEQTRELLMRIHRSAQELITLANAGLSSHFVRNATSAYSPELESCGDVEISPDTRIMGMLTGKPIG